MVCTVYHELYHELQVLSAPMLGPVERQAMWTVTLKKHCSQMSMMCNAWSTVRCLWQNQGLVE